jgi:hypothetical protein
MNDGLRLLAKILRRYGYDIKKYYQYNLLPIANQTEFNNTSILHDTSFARASPDQEEFKKLCICLRTCLKNDTSATGTPGFTGASRKETVLRCVTSLVDSINHALANHIGAAIELQVLDDRSDRGHIKSFEKIYGKLACNWEIKTTREAGQGGSLLEQFEYARDQDALFYFCEDDYLHEQSAVLEMYRFYKQVHAICGTHLVIHPQEHEFLYSRYIYPSYLLLGERRHWRTISHATHTLFMHSGTVRKYWEYFEDTRFVGDKKKRRRGVESRTTNNLFKHLPGFAPIPALAAHMQAENCLPPYFNWRAIWDKIGPG